MIRIYLLGKETAKSNQISACHYLNLWPVTAVSKINSILSLTPFANYLFIMKSIVDIKGSFVFFFSSTDLLEKKQSPCLVYLCKFNSFLGNNMKTLQKPKILMKAFNTCDVPI